jgi:hypothetical protein
MANFYNKFMAFSIVVLWPSSVVISWHLNQQNRGMTLNELMALIYYYFGPPLLQQFGAILFNQLMIVENPDG